MRFGAILFDVGGVLVAAGEPVHRRQWEAELGLPAGRLDIVLADAIGPGWRGGRSEVDIWSRVQSALAIGDTQLLRLRADLFEHEYLEPTLARYLSELRSNYRLGIITNNGPDARSHLQGRFGLCDLVDCVVISAEEGVAKPDEQIYLIAAKRLGVLPRACIFVDDSAINVAGAETVGMTGILYEGPANTLGRLRALLELS